MTCDLCREPILGQTYGPTYRDRWCYACWLENGTVELTLDMQREAYDRFEIDIDSLPELHKEVDEKINSARKWRDSLQSEIRALKNNLSESEDEIDRLLEFRKTLPKTPGMVRQESIL